MKNILVTGAGALLGQGILRCINSYDKKYNIISADPDVHSTGHALANKSYVIPFSADPNYLKRIEEIIVAENIAIILIGTDVELPIFAEKKAYLESKFNLRVVVSNTYAIKIANDKWLTSEFLKNNDFPYPLSALTTDIEQINKLIIEGDYPFIAKPIDGARSKGIKIINNEDDMHDVCGYRNNLVLQEMLKDEEGEFTTGCLVIEGKCKAIVSLTRDLRDGNTWRAYRNAETPYDEIISRIAEKLGVEGPANFQYRIKNGKPVVFEVNCRFSGTTPLRMMFGFNEVEALLNYYLEGYEINQPKLRNGIVLRAFSDVFIEKEVISSFKKDGVTANFNVEYYPFKN